MCEKETMAYLTHEVLLRNDITKYLTRRSISEMDMVGDVARLAPAVDRGFEVWSGMYPEEEFSSVFAYEVVPDVAAKIVDFMLAQLCMPEPDQVVIWTVQTMNELEGQEDSTDGIARAVKLSETMAQVRSLLVQMKHLSSGASDPKVASDISAASLRWNNDMAHIICTAAL